MNEHPKNACICPVCVAYRLSLDEAQRKLRQRAEVIKRLATLREKPPLEKR